MKFSIVIPTYNEENDISNTLDSLVALDYPDKEIIIVDDSTDSTPEIVSQYNSANIRLIRPDEKGGRCEARNIGILESEGDVVIILNADVILPVDFIKKIKIHYDNGFDYVLVKSVVSNMNDMFARYVEISGIIDHYVSNTDWMEWTEGYSCKRSVAIKAGLFPAGFPIPLCAGEDAVFGQAVKKLGAKKKIDLDIVVKHIAPASLSEYWYIRKGRGQGSPRLKYFVLKYPLSKIMVVAVLRAFKNIFYVLSIIPVLIKTYNLAKYSERKLKDFLPFYYAWTVESFAFSYGEWESILQLYSLVKNERK